MEIGKWTYYHKIYVKHNSNQCKICSQLCHTYKPVGAEKSPAYDMIELKYPQFTRAYN